MKTRGAHYTKGDPESWSSGRRIRTFTLNIYSNYKNLAITEGWTKAFTVWQKSSRAGFPTLVLKAHCPAGFRCCPAFTCMVEMITVQQITRHLTSRVMMQGNI